MKTYTGAELAAMQNAGKSYRTIAEDLGLTRDQVRERIRYFRGKETTSQRNITRLPASPYPAIINPLAVEGDALILSDLEVPFHHADFVNRCIELADAWDIDLLILAGDVMHFETFSAWGAAWQEDKPAVDSISEETETELRALAGKLEGDAQAALLAQIDKLTSNRAANDDEIKSGAKALKVLAGIFSDIYYVLGNHDDRFLRRLNSPLTPQKLLNFLGLTEKCWHIAPVYKAVLTSGGEPWHIEHQRGAGVNVAVRLADKNDAHTIAGHSHLQALNWSTNGKHYAISSGCAVDENRLAYCQRSTNSPVHKIGAVIVRDGYPFVLSELSPFDRLKRLR